MADANDTEFEEFGKYKIISEIGQGAMGVVYKAHDPILDRYVAIKTISASLGSDDELRRRFHREAQAAARLNHQNIITVYDYGEEHGKIYIAMELLEGTDLKDLLTRQALQGTDDQLAVMEQILDGLAFAHLKEVVHRDLKPGNIHIQPNGQVKILDFGLARLGASDMTQRGMVMGTPNYMSPEQVLGDSIDARSDIFSIGAVFYETLSGRKPFESESMHGVLFQVVHKEPQPIQECVEDLPLILAQIVDKCLSKDKDQRFQNGSELRDAVAVVRHALAAGRLSEVTLDAESGRVFHEGEILDEDAPPVGTPRSWPPTAAAEMGAPERAPTPNTPLANVESQSATRPRLDGTAAALEITSDSRPPGRRRTPSTLSGRSRTGAPRRRAAPPRSRRPLLAGLAALGIIVAGTAWYATLGGFPGLGTVSTDPADDVGELTQRLVSTQTDLAQSLLDGKRFEEAMVSARETLQLDPQNSAARRILAESQGRLAEIDSAASNARSLLDAGDTDAAADALHRLLQLAPGHPAVGELSSQLDSFFRSRAEDARGEMARSRGRAASADAQPSADFAAGDRLAGLAARTLEQGEFALATGGFLEARDAYQRAERAAQNRAAEKRLEEQRLAEQERRVAAAASQPSPPVREAVVTTPPEPRVTRQTPPAQLVPKPDVPLIEASAPTVRARVFRARTTQNDSGHKGPSGFEGAANPDFMGAVEFETPAAIGPGDEYAFKVFLKNVGRKRMKLRSISVETYVNRELEAVATPLLVDSVDIDERVQVAELTGVWAAGIDKWRMVVTLRSDKGDTSSNQLLLGQ